MKFLYKLNIEIPRKIKLIGTCKYFQINKSTFKLLKIIILKNNIDKTISKILCNKEYDVLKYSRTKCVKKQNTGGKNK